MVSNIKNAGLVQSLTKTTNRNRLLTVLETNKLIEELNAETLSLQNQINNITVSEVTVDINTSQMLELGTEGSQLLPAAGVGKYYSYIQIFLEYSTGSTEFTLGDGEILAISYSGGQYIAVADSSALSDTENAVWVITIAPSFENTNVPLFSSLELNSAVILTLQDTSGGGVDPTLGNGSMRAIVKYQVRTFGE
jgi:hypothetical protein